MLDTLDTNAAAVVIRAPLGFTFPSNCLDVRNGTQNPPIRCVQLPANALGQSRARLTCIAGGTGCMSGLSTFILASTPRVAPSNARDNIWFVEAVLLNSEGDVAEQLGRAELPGFTLVDMTAEVSYAPMAGVPVDIAVSFKPRVSLPSGSQIHILAPRMLRRFGCGNAVVGYINPLSLGTLRRCTDTRPTIENPEMRWSVTVVLNGTIEPGDYVMTVPAETPFSRPADEDNIFEIYVRDPAGRNADVALGILGEGLLVGFRMIAWPLWWGQAPWYVTSCEVSVPLEILDDSDVAVSMLLITLPLGPPLEHSVRSLADVSISTSQGNHLPVQELIIPDQNTLLFRLDDKVLLYAGLYAIRFRFTIPAERSRLDIWRVAICGEGPNATSVDATNCRLDGMSRDGRGSAVQAVFALPGFDPQEAPNQSPLLPVVAQASFTKAVCMPSPAVVMFIMMALPALPSAFHL